MENIVKIVVVWNPKTREILPFSYGDRGEIVIVSTNPLVTFDDYIVSLIEIDKVDFITGHVIGDDND